MITVRKCKTNKDRLILTVGSMNWHISLTEAGHLYKKLGNLLRVRTKVSNKSITETNIIVADGTKGMTRG